MQPWQLTFLGQHELPRELTSFELRYFFSFNDDERRAIRTRRRVLNQLGAALHLGFMKMSGCMLDAFEMVPRKLLAYLGRELEVDVPTVTSVRALYRRRRRCMNINDGRPRRWDFILRTNINDAR
jgi:hypothetical protein